MHGCIWAVHCASSSRGANAGCVVKYVTVDPLQKAHWPCFVAFLTAAISLAVACGLLLRFFALNALDCVWGGGGMHRLLICCAEEGVSIPPVIQFIVHLISNQKTNLHWLCDRCADDTADKRINFSAYAQSYARERPVALTMIIMVSCASAEVSVNSKFLPKLGSRAVTHTLIINNYTLPNLLCQT